MISIAINTCSKRAHDVPERYPLSSGGKHHALRYRTLRDIILPYYIRDPRIDRVVVVGEFEEGNGYEYIESPSLYYNAIDALVQREIAAEALEGAEAVLFQHDDHVIGSDFLTAYADKYYPDAWWDVLTMRRVLWDDRADETLPHYINSGDAWIDGGYVQGHFCIYHPAALKLADWRSVDRRETWDLSQTALLRDQGLIVKHAPDLVFYDLELGDIPPHLQTYTIVS